MHTIFLFSYTSIITGHTQTEYGSKDSTNKQNFLSKTLYLVLVMNILLRMQGLTHIETFTPPSPFLVHATACRLSANL